MNHIMLDLETMGTNPNAAIVAIGAVAMDFDTNKIGPTFYQTIMLESSMQSGGIVDGSTVAWWMKQGEQARQEIYKAENQLSPTLLAFADFIKGISSHDDIRVWGDGAAFDNVILASSYRRLSLPLPWKYWNDRCYRTMKKLYNDVKTEPVGIEHNALDDAMSQALHLLAIYKSKNLGRKS
ncbi:MAG: 3'-5' exonuclease [Methylococcaceae bacterium]|jgi:exodeoxyribonuclease VIII